MATNSLLTLTEGAAVFGLAGAESFSRFAQAHGLPLVRFGRKVVRVRREDIDRAIEAHLEAPAQAGNRELG